MDVEVNDHQGNTNWFLRELAEHRSEPFVDWAVDEIINLRAEVVRLQAGRNETITMFWAPIRDEDFPTVGKWQPVGHDGSGMLTSIDMWFETEEACWQFIDSSLIGAGHYRAVST